jgi:hypothetical protein
MRASLFGALLLIVAAVPLRAQSNNSCGDDETIPGCFSRLVGAVEVGAAAADVQESVAAANTGVPTLTSPLGSSLKDFLSVFTAFVDTAALTEDDSGALTLDWNFGSARFTTGRPFKAQAVFHKAQLNPQIKAALTGELLQETEGSLDDTDDVTASLSYSPQTRGLGRTLSPHRALFELLLAEARRAEGRDPQTFAFLQLVQPFQAQPPFTTAQSLDSITFKQLTIPQRARIEPAVIAYAQEQLAIDEGYKRALTAVGVDKFRTLLHQQPQLYGSVLVRTRNELVGANEMSFKLTYETSGRGLRSFYSASKRTCNDAQLQSARNAPDSGVGIACLDAWRDFLAEDKTQAAIAGAGRFAFSLEYTGVAENEVSIASPPSGVTPDPFTLHTDDSESLIGSVTWSRELTRIGAASREGRFDATASYENVTGDEDRDNRFVVSAVYSQKINDRVTIPLGIAYANRDRYLKDVSDRGISMHFGLIYKLPMTAGMAGQ